MRYRVWAKNWNGGITVLTDWMTRAQCQRFIILRWGHWPPFAYISKAKARDAFVRANGD